MKDFVVYTAITDGYDVLKNPSAQWLHDADFVAFMETPQDVPGWSIRPICHRFRDPCRNAKIHKILPHRFFHNVKFSLWIDGSIRIISDSPLSAWPEKYLYKYDLAVFKHRLRCCIYAEAAACIELGLDSKDLISKQMQKYYESRYPYNAGLAECTILFRRHTPRMAEFNEAWYKEIRTYSRRDQLSFNYCARKLGIKYAFLPGSISDNAHFEWMPHLAR